MEHQIPDNAYLEMYLFDLNNDDRVFELGEELCKKFNIKHIIALVLV